MTNDLEGLMPLWRELSKDQNSARTQRVSQTEVLAQYFAIDHQGNFNYYINASSRPERLEELTAVSITCVQMKDGKWRRTLTLLNSEFFEEFATLVASMVSATRDKSSEQSALRGQQSAYEQWLAFYRKRQSFTLSSARGLFGELLVLRTSQATRGLSWGVALDSWKGPQGSPQDFIFPTYDAIEVKTVNLSAKRVKISGAEQLDFAGPLELRVIRLVDNTDASSGSTLNQEVDNLISLLTPMESMKLKDSLSDLGFDPKSEFSSARYFEAVDVASYVVDGDFPRLTVANLPSSVEGVVYELRLRDIEKYRSKNKGVK